MTDDELKDLVASIAVSQMHTDEQMKLTDERLTRTEELIKQAGEQMKRTDEQLKRTDEKLERVSVQLGNISRNQGDVAEEFFYNSLLKDNYLDTIAFDGIPKNEVAEEFFYHSLIKDNHLGTITFDDITKNMGKRRGNIQEKYDLFMTNGDSIAIVEVKYKAHTNDLDELDQKFNNFKKLFPTLPAMESEREGW